MAEIKLCKDCKHAEKASSTEFYKCAATFIFELDYVSGGRERTFFQYCDRNRLNGGTCGQAGKLFEPKPRPWYAFWMAA